MASSPESYEVEREFAESFDDPFEAIIELRTRVAELEEAARVVLAASGWEAESRAKGELSVVIAGVEQLGKQPAPGRA